jgi:hypothetical protein
MYIWNSLKISFSKSVETADAVGNKTMNAFFKSFQELATSDAYRKVVCKKLFPNINIGDEHYRIAFNIAAYIRKEILRQHVNPIKENAEKTARTETGTKFEESDGGKGKIRYLGGWCLSSVRKQRVRRIFANVYNP